MRLEVTGRHITVTPAIRTLVELRIAHILRMLNDSAVSAQVVLTKEKSLVRAELTLHARGEHFLHGAATGRDVPTALGAAADKLDRQAQKLKSRWTEGKRQGLSASKAAAAAPRAERESKGISAARGRAAEPPAVGSARAAASSARSAAASARGDDDRQPRIIRARRYEVKPMTVDDAALEVAEGDHAFLVFRNADSDEVNVLFRRPDGNLGLIEPEA